MKKVNKFLVFAILMLSMCCNTADNITEKPDKLARSYLKGKEVKFISHKHKFQIPEEWLDWNKNFHDNFHFSIPELEKVKDGYGEWDTEYANVINAVLPFENCVLHAGGEGWGKQSSSFGDLQMRVYIAPITSLSPAEISVRVNNQGLKAARAISKHAQLAKNVYEDWTVSSLTYGVWYYDYGGTAKIDFYVTSTKTESIVLVFMHVEYLDEAKKIVDSFIVEQDQ